MYRTRRIALILIGFLFSAVAAFAAPAVAVWPTVGPPTSRVIVNGTGFNASAAVDVYYGTAHLCLAFADATGFANRCRSI